MERQGIKYMDSQLIIDTISSIASLVFFISIITMVIAIVKKRRKSKNYAEASGK